VKAADMDLLAHDQLRDVAVSRRVFGLHVC
jgi:hypothetical protein